MFLPEIRNILKMFLPEIRNILKMFSPKISENTEMLSLYTNTAMCIGLKMRLLSIPRKFD